MRYLPVHWSEGLFLKPHHFQATDRAWSELLQTSEQWDHQYNYGIRRIAISHEAIGNFQFQVNTCHARMKDGTIVALDPGQELDRVDLKEAFAKESTVRVYLALPKLKIGSVNVDANAGKQRFVEAIQSVQDESLGGNDQELPFRRLNVRLLLSTQDSAGYEVLPIAQLQRSGDHEATPQLDDTYFPPMLAVDAWAPLGREIVLAIHDVIGKAIEVLSEQVASRRLSFASTEPGDLDRVLMLSLLNACYCTLGVLAFASGVHPLTAYTELCRIVGQLSIFSPQRRPPEIPRYDHDDLARIFRYIRDQILLLLNALPKPQYERRFFVGEGKGMRVSLESTWLGSEWQWFVGMLRGNLPERDCMAILAPGGLDWKLGSSRQVDGMFERGQESLQLTPLRQAPSALPPAKDWLYFEVLRNNAAWRDVLETQTLAMRLRDTAIVNRAELPGQQKIVIAAGGKRIELQFALFAVRITK
jgi:type VI secretion system protein ImpJ